MGAQAMTTTSIVILICAVIAIGVGAWYFFQQRRTQQLRARFGPEYQDALREYGGRSTAEKALLERQKRREKLHIRSLSSEEKESFSRQWGDLQKRFVDDPAASIREADALVSDVLRARGYPMAEFDHRAEDISVDHPMVVRNYRAAHEIAIRHERGQASTEDLRQALVFYRELFDDLLEAQTMEPRGVRR
jgi:hypothetical protein